MSLPTITASDTTLLGFIVGVSAGVGKAVNYSYSLLAEVSVIQSVEVVYYGLLGGAASLFVTETYKNRKKIINKTKQIWQKVQTLR